MATLLRPQIQSSHPFSNPAQVGAVYYHCNLWANVQPCGSPWDISWSLGDVRSWRPLFGPHVSSTAITQ
jgi:hypothetical protein